MRTDALYLADIGDAIDAIERFTANIDEARPHCTPRSAIPSTPPTNLRRTVARPGFPLAHRQRVTLIPFSPAGSPTNCASQKADAMLEPA
jgi:hypothetical protein